MVKNYYLSDGDIQLSENFKLSEFQCKNGTNEIKVSDILVDYLERLKAALNADSLVINSGYRTSDYSVSVGGGRSDPHTKGIASDIYAYRNGELVSGAELCCKAQDVGFGGIGYMGNAIHVDVRNEEEYYNNHWWGDENADCNVDDWYSYFSVDKPIIEGWVQEGACWCYYRDNERVVEDWIVIDDSWYYFDDKGYMVAGAWVHNASGTWSYCDNEGKAVTGCWDNINGKWYNFDNNGVMRSDEWIKNDSGTWSYVNADGEAVTGWNELDYEGVTNWYYFDENGTMLKNEWVKDYFVGNSGAMLTNIWIAHEDKYYWVGEDGKWFDNEGWSLDGEAPSDGHPIYEY